MGQLYLTQDSLTGKVTIKNKISPYKEFYRTENVCRFILYMGFCYVRRLILYMGCCFKITTATS